MANLIIDYATIFCIILSIGTLSVKTERIDGISQVFNISCDPHVDENIQGYCHSKSLKTIADKVQKSSDVIININISQLDLMDQINFTKLHSLTINGKVENMTAVNCVSDNASIIFSDVTGTVALNNLILTYCGSQIHYKNKIYRLAMALIHCRNVKLSGLIVTKSRGIGLMILNHLGGEVSLKLMTFKENKLPKQYITKSILGGGGVFIYNMFFSTILSFINCTFVDNIAHNKRYDFLYTNVIGIVQGGYGRGGGVYLRVKSSANHVSILFFGCYFVDNQALIGGGIAVNTFVEKLERKRNNIDIEIKNCIFEQNGCNQNKEVHGFGGALHLTDAHYLIKNVRFTKGCADIGGGVFYSSNYGREHFINNTKPYVLFESCLFNKNTAYIGSAVKVTPSTFSSLSSSDTITPTLKNCIFLENSAFINHPWSNIATGIGIVHVTSHHIHFQAYTNFENNQGSALYISNGNADFQNSSVSFINNTGVQGGAVALIGSSTMIIGPHEYNFINNTATSFGGALYVLQIDITDFTISRSCFIQYRHADSNTLVEWNANVTFTGNKARDGTAGHAIYATSLYSCQVIKYGQINQSEYSYVNTSEVFIRRGVKFDDDEIFQPQMATDGAVLHSSKSTPLMIIPGENFDHGVTITDDLGQPVPATFMVTVSNEGTNTNKQSDLISPTSAFVKERVEMIGKPNQSARLSLQTLSPRQSSIELGMQLVECPPGFMLDEGFKCVCNTDAYVGLLNCDLDSFHSYLLPGYWVGLIESPNGLELVTCRCPFCDYSNSFSNASEFEITLPQTYSGLERAVCGEKRTGVACGKCQDNYTVHFHSPGFLCKQIEPVDCKLGWFFYILSELVPITLVFITVLVFNISFTSGAVNGFILYSQLLDTLNVDASGIITFPNSVKQSMKDWTQAYRIMYGFFNLDFFTSESLSFCLWKGATALDMLAFKYFTILYTLMLLVAVIWIMNKCAGKYCGKCCRITNVRTSIVHGISSFLVICYAQCIKVSLGLLISV